MTAKEKAIELYNSMLDMLPPLVNQTGNLIKDTVKGLACISVDEILNDISSYLGDLNPKRVYWNEVKQEIEKL